LKILFKEECDVNIIINNIYICDNNKRSGCIYERIIWVDMRLISSMELSIV